MRNTYDTAPIVQFSLLAQLGLCPLEGIRGELGNS